MVAGWAALERDAEVDLVHVQPWLNKEAAETEMPRLVGSVADKVLHLATAPVLIVR